MAKQKRPAAVQVPVTTPEPRPSNFICFACWVFFFLALPLSGAAFPPGVPGHRVGTGPAVPETQFSQSAPAPAQQAAPQQSPAPDRATAARIAELEKAVIRNPSDRNAFVELGNLYFDADQAKLSIMAYENALRLKADDPSVMTDLGVMYRRDGQYQKALDCFKKTLEIEPGHPVALFNTGIVFYYDLHDAAGARKAWEELLKTHPDAKAPDGTPVTELLKQLK